MSRDAYEPYEVALSNSQIAAVAALLLLAIVGAFAAGAWWGRSNAVEIEQPDALEAGITLPSAPPPVVVDPVEEEAEPPEIVRFFGAEGQEAAGDVVAEPAPPTAGAGLVIQVFSSVDPAQAASVERKLRADGHRAFVSPQTLDGQVMQRVRVGPFESQDAAGEAAEQLSKQYGLETWITPNN